MPYQLETEQDDLTEYLGFPTEYVSVTDTPRVTEFYDVPWASAFEATRAAAERAAKAASVRVKRDRYICNIFEVPS